MMQNMAGYGVLKYTISRWGIGDLIHIPSILQQCFYINPCRLYIQDTDSIILAIKYVEYDIVQNDLRNIAINTLTGFKL